MSALIIFVFFFIISHTSYVGGDLIYALSFLLGWYVLLSVPLIFTFIVQTWAYITTVNNPSIIKIDENCPMTKDAALKIVYDTYNRGFGTLTRAVILIFIKIVLTVLSLYLISPVAVSMSDISVKALMCFGLLMSINIYQLFKGIRKCF